MSSPAWLLPVDTRIVIELIPVGEAPNRQTGLTHSLKSVANRMSW